MKVVRLRRREWGGLEEGIGSPRSCFGKPFQEIYAVPKMVVHLVDGTYELFRHRVKGFASRGLVVLP